MPRVPGEAVADVWVMLFDPDGAGNRAIKVPHPMTEATTISGWGTRPPGSISCSWPAQR